MEKYFKMSFEHVFSQMIILFIVLIIGYVANKAGFLDSVSNKKISSLIMNLAIPCKVLSSLNQAECTGKDLVTMTVVTALTFLLLMVFAKIVPIVLCTKGEKAPILEFMTVFSNNGFMGYPVIEAVLGASALIYAGVYSIFTVVLFFSYGVYLFQKSKAGIDKIEWRKMISPSSIGGTLALILAFFEFRFSEVPYEVLSMIGGVTTPLSMLIIGSSLAAIPLKEVFKGWRVYAFSVIRLMVVPAIVYLVFFKFISNPMILGVIVLTAAMPSASTAVMFAEQYDNNAPYAAQHVFITTLFAVLTIPIVGQMLF